MCKMHFVRWILNEMFGGKAFGKWNLVDGKLIKCISLRFNDVFSWNFSISRWEVAQVCVPTFGNDVEKLRVKQARLQSQNKITWV